MHHFFASAIAFLVTCALGLWLHICTYSAKICLIIAEYSVNLSIVRSLAQA